MLLRFRSAQGAAPGLAAMALTLVLLTAASQARAGSASAGQGAGPKDTLSWGMGPMGPMGQQRSADAHFIVMMIPHHEGAIAMAELALKQARHPEIRALAERIKLSQSQENAQMRGWYQEWFAGPVPPSPGPGPGWGMGMGMLGMGTSLQALRTAPDFDRTFLEQMIAHHRMGVMMASHAQWGTVHPQLRALQAAMVRVQSQEIDQMEQWYRQWYGSGSAS